MQANLQHTDCGINSGGHPAEHTADTSKFLTAIWGADDDGRLPGVHFIAEPTMAGWRHHPAYTLAEAVRKALEISESGKNAYFALAEYLTEGSRKGENASQVQAFWLDIDCGEAKAAGGKGYSIKREAAIALAGFCKTVGLPHPGIVDSGNGLHVYWTLDAPVSADEWHAVAGKLKALTTEHGLLADPSRTADRASVLRVPGTMNRKDPANPKPVKLKRMNEAVSFSEFKAAIDAAAGNEAAIQISDLSGGLEQNRRQPLPETPENVAQVRSMLAVIPADCGRDEWRNVVWGVLSTGLSAAVELAREWSMTSDKYDPVAFDKVVASYEPQREGGVGFGSLVHHAKQHGWVEPDSIENGPVQSALREFSKRYFVARVGGGVYVFDEHDKEMLAGAMTFTAFQQLHAGHVVDGVNVASKWLKWAGRRTYHSIIFDPSQRGGSDSYNTWRGLALAPAYGSCRRVLEHIRAIWCSGNDGQFHYVTRWMAMLVQRPWEKPEVALVLRSREGSGKTMIVDILLGFFGVHAYTAAQKEQVAGRFNGHLFDKVLVVLEEAFFAGDPAAVAATKALVTNRTIGYEAKGKDSFNAANYAHVINLTNHSWAVPAGEDSRRWMVLDVDDSKRGDHTYFTELSAEIANGGNSAFLQYLMGIDLTGWNPRALPESKALHTQQIETLSRTNPVAGWWLHALTEGSFTVDGGAIDWCAEILAADLQDSYQRATARMRGAPGWDSAAKQLRKLVPPGALGRTRRSGPDGRHFSYLLPDLDEARTYFRAVTGVDPCAS